MSDKGELWDLQLEQLVLGSCILDAGNLLRYQLSPEDFYSHSNALIWSELQSLRAAARTIDTVHLHAHLADTNRLERVGGYEYVLRLTDTIPQRDLPIERLHRLRRLRALQSVVRSVQGHVQNADLDQAISALGEAHRAAFDDARSHHTGSVVDFCEGLLDELDGATPPAQRVHLGYSILTEKLGMLPLGSTFAVLASTNVGKSSFCIELLTRSAERGETVGYLSVEDQRDLVCSRFVSLMSGVSSRQILHRRVDRAAEVPRIVRGVAQLHALKERLYASILQGGTEIDVCAAMTELASRGCKVVVVDYLQKIESSRSYNSKAHEVSATASRITSHAQRLGVALVLVSQCTRDKTRINECPSKHDMKESGDIENMCDAIVGLWREFEDDYAPVWARLLKVKWGGVGLAWQLRRDRDTGRLHEVEASDKMQPPDARAEWSHRRGACGR